MWTQRLGVIGVWRGVEDADATLAKTIEDLGYGTIWLGGSPGSHLSKAEVLLDATEFLHIATGVVNIWKADPAELADSYHRIEAKHAGRLLLGIGSGCARSRRWLGILTSWTSTVCPMRPGCSRRWVRGCSHWRQPAVPAPTHT